jgi:hypothetical protein
VADARSSGNGVDVVRNKCDDPDSVSIHSLSGFLDEEEFFDFISRFQSKRMDDQRCALDVGLIASNNADILSRCQSGSTIAQNEAKPIFVKINELVLTLEKSSKTLGYL